MARKTVSRRRKAPRLKVRRIVYRSNRSTHSSVARTGISARFAKYSAKGKTKPEFFADQKRKGRSPKQAQAAWDLSRTRVKAAQRRSSKAAKKAKSYVRKGSYSSLASFQKAQPKRWAGPKKSTAKRKTTRARKPAKSYRVKGLGGKHTTRASFIADQQRKGRTAAQAAATWKMVSKNAGRSKVAKRGRRWASVGASKAKRSVRRGSYGSIGELMANRGTIATKPKSKGRVTKASFIRSQRRTKSRTRNQAEADWRLKTRKGARTYGPFKPAKASIAGRSYKTYVVRGKGRKIRHIPDWALKGYSSAKEYNAILKGKRGPEKLATLHKRDAKLASRRAAAAKRAVTAAQKASARAAKGKQLGGMYGIFSPNGDLIEMRPNARKRRKKKQTAKQKAASLRNLRKARAAMKRGGRKVTRRKITRRKSGYRRKSGTMTKGKRRAATLKGIRRSKARRGLVANRKRRVTKRRVTKRRVTRRRSTSMVLANRKRRSIKRRSTKRRSIKRRSYRRNVSGAAYMTELKNALKTGAIATTGFMAHRALTKVISDQALSKIDYFTTGSMAKHKGLVSGLLAALVGIPVATKLIPGSKTQTLMPFVAGMATSLLHAGITQLLSGQPKLVGYLSSYPNAGGRAYGSYYSFKPGQSYKGMRGYGEYYQTSGFGQMRQAAAGMGRMRQAAAGMGRMTQAAAGVGQARMAQAAAGTGEYIAYGASGIGEYEQVATGRMPMRVNEGIYPTLNHAEQALSVAEAAAGVGQADIALQSTVNPNMTADPISDLPGGSRAGVFEGGDGIF